MNNLTKSRLTFLLLTFLFHISLFGQDYEDIQQNRRWNNMDYTSGEVWAIFIGIGLLAFSVRYFLTRKESNSGPMEIAAVISGIIGFVCLVPLFQAAFSAAITLLIIVGGGYFVLTLIEGK